MLRNIGKQQQSKNNKIKSHKSTVKKSKIQKKHNIKKHRNNINQTTKRQYGGNPGDGGEYKQDQIMINGLDFKLPQQNTTYVGITIDGIDMDYINRAMDAGYMPSLKRITSPPDFGTFHATFMNNKKSDQQQQPTKKKTNFFQAEGNIGIAASAFPTIGSTNHVSILTGVPPIEHGVCNDQYYDIKTNKFIKMNTTTQYIRTDSILRKLYDADPENTTVTIVTTKQRLCNLLKHQFHDITPANKTQDSHNTNQQLNSVNIVSIESLQHQQQQNNNTNVDFITNLYQSIQSSSSDNQALSSATDALQLAYKIHQQQQQTNGLKDKKNLFYVTLDDVAAIPQKFAPGSSEANAMLQQFDNILGKLHDDGVVVGFTAAHGMNDKVKFNGAGNIVFLQDELMKNKDLNLTPDDIHITLPLPPVEDSNISTEGKNDDDFFAGYAMVYVKQKEGETKEQRDALLHGVYTHLRNTPGCYSVLGKTDAVRGLDLHPDFIGDVVILGDKSSAFGITSTTPAAQRVLQQTDQGLRSFGSLEESLVPLMYNRPLNKMFGRDFGKGRVRNYELFSNMLNNLEL